MSDPFFFETREAFRACLEEALCFRWIDGLINGIDDETYKRRL